jgi:prepilin peptidase CpaA
MGLIAGGAFTALLVMASVYDIRTRRIPNRLVGMLVVLGLLYSLINASMTHATLFGGVLGLLLGLVLWLPFYLMGWLGAGDVKLFAASGAWLGPDLTLEAALLAALAGGILALIWMLRAYGMRGTAVTASLLEASPSVVPQRSSVARGAVPYGVALATGVLVAAWTHSGLVELIHAIR